MILQILRAFILCLAVGQIGICQPSDIFRGRNQVVGLEGVLIDNKPALRITPTKGASITIRFGNRDGEEVLAFPVIHMHQMLYAGYAGETGVIYVSRKTLSYAPDSKSLEHGFEIGKSDIKKVQFSKSSYFGRNIGSSLLVKTGKQESRFAILPGEPEHFDGLNYRAIKHDDLLPVVDYLQKAISNFDTALKDFREITSQLKSGDQTTSLETVGRSLVDIKNLNRISSEYDRFKDITTVRLQTIISKPDDVRYESLGPVFSMIVGYEFAGTIQAKPVDSFTLVFQLAVFDGNRASQDVFNYNEEFITLADEGRLLMTMQRSAYRDSLGVKYEILSCPITADLLRKITLSKKVEMRLARTEFELRFSQLQSLRDFLRRADNEEK